MKNIQSIQSLGFKTEMIFHCFDGIVLHREKYLVVKTPSNPGFYFGNFLLFFEAPKVGSLSKWKELFQREFSDNSQIKHFTFLWDSPKEGIGEISEFQKEGFQVDFSAVLKATKVNPPKFLNDTLEVRPLSTDSDWSAATENQILSKSNQFKEEEYRLFKERQMARYRAMAASGVGDWFGAFLNGKLVGDLGIFKDGTIGRFQSVETHPDFLRRGVCGTLVYESAQFAFKKMGLTDLVMVADENYHAAKIYESVGFKPFAKEYSACYWENNAAEAKAGAKVK